MRDWKEASVEELELKETMYGGTREHVVDDNWIDGNQRYEAYEKS